MENTTSEQLLTDTIQFPLLGIRSDESPFEYLPISVQNRSLKIAIFNWFVNRSVLNAKEQVDLLIPIFPHFQSASERNLLGEITDVNANPIVQAIEYEVTFGEGVPSFGNEMLNADTMLSKLRFTSTTLHEMLIEVIKDTKLLKAGINIYLKHLHAYFSRVSRGTVANYALLNKAILEDITNHVEQNTLKLSELHARLQKHLTSTSQIPIEIDLEQVREFVESEISLPLMGIAFSEEETLKNVSIKTLLSMNISNICITYMRVIKSLERRLYINYNTIVLIYIKALSTTE
jgi:hypothetical protein